MPPMASAELCQSPLAVPAAALRARVFAVLCPCPGRALLHPRACGGFGQALLKPTRGHAASQSALGFLWSLLRSARVPAAFKRSAGLLLAFVVTLKGPYCLPRCSRAVAGHRQHPGWGWLLRGGGAGQQACAGLAAGDGQPAVGLSVSWYSAKYVLGVGRRQRKQRGHWVGDRGSAGRA